MTTPLVVKDKSIPNKSIKIEPFRKHVRKTAAHKHNSYFELVFLSKGTGTHTIDEVCYVIEPHIVFTVRKDQVHHWDITSEPEGYVLIIKNDFVANSLDKEIKQLIYQFSKYNCIKTNEALISDFFRVLCLENKQEGTYRRSILEGLVKALLGKLLQLSEGEQSTALIKEHTYQRFSSLLHREKGLVNSVAHYAEILNTTPQNLNVICRKEVQKTASQVIAEHIVAESKRLLLYTDMNVSEICDYLHFSDNSNFTKYFKRSVGVTPDVYRKQSS